MATTAADLNAIVKPYVKRLQQDLDLDSVFFIDEAYDGVNGALSDVRFIVVSPSFEGMDHTTRLRRLGLLGAIVNSAIQAWPYTPREIARHSNGEKYDLFLAQFLSGAREVYARSANAPRKNAGGEP